MLGFPLRRRAFLLSVLFVVLYTVDILVSFTFFCFSRAQKINDFLHVFDLRPRVWHEKHDYNPLSPPFLLEFYFSCRYMLGDGLNLWHLTEAGTFGAALALASGDANKKALIPCA